ncbi:MAG: galactokinase [Verrucomicrobia bacterium RIFCSPLOWO2_12_FULL_64_8]|nr:MAG: galactokinase [Verrucomicrobia bacterium RIFCSPLOWO2_12_FULL_64_8]
MTSELVERFTRQYGHAPTVLARAPGRIEFIGNHTDHNGGTVLGAAINLDVRVAAGPAPAGTLRFASEHFSGAVTVPAGDPRKQTGAQSWVNYPLGVWASLKEFGLRQPNGVEYLALADLPSGAGLSSSAAIELATALAFLGLTGDEPARETIVKLGRHAENNFVGVPCGILDQGVSGFGKKDRLVFIDCRGPSFKTVPLPAGAHFWIFNTHAKHALVDGLYATRHRECQDAARSLGVALLADLTPAILEQARAKLPPVYFLRAKHVVEEIDRVARVRTALARGDLVETGRLLVASHRSSQTQFENSTAELDFLVDMLAAAPHVFGARLTGGGFGGAVMALTDAEFTAVQAAQIAQAYRNRFGSEPDVLHCETGDGAARIAA